MRWLSRRNGLPMLLLHAVVLAESRYAYYACLLLLHLLHVAVDMQQLSFMTWSHGCST